MKAGSLATAIAAYLLGVSAGRFRAPARGQPAREVDSSSSSSSPPLARSSLSHRPGAVITPSRRNNIQVVMGLGDVSQRQEDSKGWRQPSPVHVSFVFLFFTLPVCV